MDDRAAARLEGCVDEVAILDRHHSPVSPDELDAELGRIPRRCTEPRQLGREAPHLAGSGLRGEPVGQVLIRRTLWVTVHRASSPPPSRAGGGQLAPAVPAAEPPKSLKHQPPGISRESAPLRGFERSLLRPPSPLRASPYRPFVRSNVPPPSGAIPCRRCRWSPPGGPGRPRHTTA